MACRGDKLPPRYWTDRDILHDEVRAHGTLSAVSRAHGGAPQTLARWWVEKHKLPKLPSGHPVTVGGGGIDTDATWLLETLKRLKGRQPTIDLVADTADVSPRRVRQAITQLEEAGYRIEVAGELVSLGVVVPDKHHLHRGLLEGTTLRLGVVSDTHLGSNEEALAELHLAYDWFASEGIEQVLHAGDWITGRRIYRGQDSEIKVHTLDAQIGYAAEHYPRRDGIRTFGIGGNHDLEGEAGGAGFDPIVSLASRRDDIEYLGPYSAWLQVGGETGPWVHLLHGRGGMSYAYSYKAQKLVDGYPSGRKPALLIVGHWHVRGSIEARGVEVVFPGCFEWQSRFLQRLGLSPAVGFHLLEVTFGPDGSIVQFMPRWFRIWEGRVVG